MKRTSIIIPLLITFGITLIVFYKTFFFGHLPFPGDLLVSEYAPWTKTSYLGYSPGSYPNKAQYFDTLRQMYPWKTLAVDMIKQGHIPLWNPYNFSGTPLLANFQSAVFHPTTLLYFIFDKKYAWAISVILQIGMSLFCTYLYARKIGIGTIGAWFSSVAYSLSSFMTVWLEYNTVGHIIATLPLLLLCIEHLSENASFFWKIVFLFAATSALFAGHPQVFVYMYVFVALYTLLRLRKYIVIPRNAFLILVLFSLPLGLGAIQLLPGLELLTQAARSNLEYDFLMQKILIQPHQLIMALTPDFFGNPATRNYYISDTYVGKMVSIGSIPLLFALLSFTKKRTFYQLFFMISSCIVLLLTTANPFTGVLYRFPIPFFSSSNPTLSLFLCSFSLAILSGWGVTMFQKNTLHIVDVVKRILPLLLIVCVTWMLLFTNRSLLTPEQFSLSTKMFLYTNGLLGFGIISVYVTKRFSRLVVPLLLILLCITVFDALRAFHKFNPFVPAELVFPEATIASDIKKITGHNRIIGVGAAHIQSNLASYFRYYAPEGYDPLYPKEYGMFMHASKEGKLLTAFTRENRSDAYIAMNGGNEKLYKTPYGDKLASVLGVKYMLDRMENGASEKVFPIDQYHNVYSKDGWIIYENARALPRAFFVNDYKVYTSIQEFNALFFKDTFNPSSTLLLEQAKIDKKNSVLTNGEAKIVSYTPQEVVIQTKNEGNGLLFLSDTFYPGWKAFIDDTPTEIYRAQYAFRGISVPEGAHTVRFRYKPDSFTYGLLISIISLSIVIIVSVFPFLRKKFIFTKQ